MMEALHQSRPAEEVTLQMENELLAQEVAHLRARLAGRGGASGHVATNDGPVPEAYRKAWSDIRWLISRLDSSPARFLLERFDGYLVLRDRYGEDT